MTADDNRDSESDNVTSRHDWSIDPDDVDALLSVLEYQGGFSTKDGLIYQLGMRVREVEELLGYLAANRRVDIYDLGRLTLITGPEMDPREAYTQICDREERQWRRLTGDDFVDPDDR